MPPPNPIVRPIPVPVPVPVKTSQPPVLRPPVPFKDYGPAPFVVNIEQATLANDYYRQTLWSGPHMQSTLMCIPPGGDIGLEVHPDNDQFLRLEQGQGLCQMGESEKNLTVRQTVFENSAVFVPAGTWHNITNIGTTPMKLYVIYAPPHHPHGTVHATKAIADKMGD
jgi:mannose-6-phosphate isomerase-like protein (cupin superfamily)